MTSVGTTLKRPPLWVLCGFLLILWQILLWAQNPGLMSDDSGEMVAASYTLGLPHPPGYPLFCLLGRLFSFVPVGTIAYRENLLSSLFLLTSLIVIGMTGFVFANKKKVNADWFPIGVIGSVLLFIFSCRSVFGQALTAKGGVYTLTLLFLSLFWWLRVQNLGKGFSVSLFLFVWFLWSVGMTNHWESEIFWASFLILWMWQEKSYWDIKRILQTLSVITIGFSVYLYLPLRAVQKPFLCWGNPVSLKEFLWVITRKLASGTEPLFHPFSYYLSFSEEYLKVLALHWMPGLILLILWGAVCLYRSQRDLFYSSLILYFPMVLGILTVPREETKFLIAVYLVPTQAILSFYLLAGLLDRNSKIWRAGAVLLAMLVCGWTFWIFQKEDKNRYTLASDFSLNAIKALPSHAILLAEGDNFVMPFFYEREVLGLRRDLVFETAIFLVHDWGWQQLTAQDEEVDKALRSTTTFGGRLDALTALGLDRGLFYDLNLAYTRGAFLHTKGDWIPWALTERYSERVLTTDEVSAQVLRLTKLERLRNLDQPYDPADVPTFEIYHYYADQYFGTGRWLRQKGDLEKALVFFDRGLKFYPKAAFAYSEMGAMAGQLGYLNLAKELCQTGIDNDPAYLPGYVNLAHVYHLEKMDRLAQNCFDQALQKVSDNGWLENQKDRFLSSLGKAEPPQTPIKSPADHLLLADRLQKEGAVILPSLARTAVNGKDP